MKISDDKEENQTSVTSEHNDRRPESEDNAIVLNRPVQKPASRSYAGNASAGTKSLQLANCPDERSEIQPDTAINGPEARWPELVSAHDEFSNLILGRLRSPDLAAFLLFVDQFGGMQLFPTLGNSNLEKITRMMIRMPAKTRRELSSLIQSELRRKLNLLCAEFVNENPQEHLHEIFPVKPRRNRKKRTDSAKRRGQQAVETEDQVIQIEDKSA